VIQFTVSAQFEHVVESIMKQLLAAGWPKAADFSGERAKRLQVALATELVKSHEDVVIQPEPF
jgi:hypothetical protein